MKLLKSQDGFIPLPILLALAIAAIIGGIIGYKLGDGSVFFFGVVCGIVLLFGPHIIMYIKKLKRAWTKDED